MSDLDINEIAGANSHAWLASSGARSLASAMPAAYRPPLAAQPAVPAFRVTGRAPAILAGVFARLNPERRLPGADRQKRVRMGRSAPVSSPPAWRGREPRGAARDSPPGDARGAVLLIERDCEVRWLTARVLAGVGHIVHAAASAPEVLALFARYQSQLVLLVGDPVLPGAPGASDLLPLLLFDKPALRLLLTALPEHPVRCPGFSRSAPPEPVWCPGFSRPAFPEPVRCPGFSRSTPPESPAFHFLPKPYNPACLLRAVHQILGNR